MKTITGCLALLVSFLPAGSLLAHHSLASFDVTTPVRVKGTIVRFHAINPHSFIYLEEAGTNRRWALEGPSLLQLTRQGLMNALKPGDVVEVCGYLPKEPIVWQIASADPARPSLAGRLLNAELLVFPDGREQNWGDYGVHKCFGPAYKDQHSK
jgi:hypothetical protein